MNFSKILKVSNLLLIRNITTIKKPTSSEVLTSYLKQCNEPPWTSYFVKYSSVTDDQFGLANFNWKVGGSNYQILRTGCYPYIKYHCSKKEYCDLTLENNFMRLIKIVNLGIPCILYGLAAILLIKHEEVVNTPNGSVKIHFLITKALDLLMTPSQYLTGLKSGDQTFKIYWNSPTTQCHKYNINFEEIDRDYGMRQNKKDSFRGDQIALLYDPGKFPALLEQKDTTELFFRNGGLPQYGDLAEHLKEFRQQLDKLVPDKNFDGLGVIDFESWRPVFRQNFGVLTPYKDISIDKERERNPDRDEKVIKAEAIKRFEEAAPPYMLETLKVAKEARPLAKWGYYAFPYCFNMNTDQKVPNCPDIVVEENNRMIWLWDEVDLMLPSVYMSKKRLNAEERQIMVKGRIAEAKRLAALSDSKPEIYPYLWYKYSDETSEFLTKDDLYNAINLMKTSGLNGVILWGSSGDVNNKDNCEALYNYVKDVLGPVVKELRSGSRKNSNSD